MTEIESFQIKIPQGVLFAKKWKPQKQHSDLVIVMMHDSLGCVDMWKDFPQQLCERLAVTVIAYDRLGFGRSSMNPNKPTISFIEEEANQFFLAIKKHFALDKFIALGHSVGGGMSLQIASIYADCVGVISISAQAYVEQLTIDGIKSAQQLFQDKEQRDKLYKWHGDKTDWVLSAWIDTWLSKEFANWTLCDLLSRVTCPALVIHGDSDEYGTLAFPNSICQALNGPTQKLIIEDCGHMPHKQKTTQVLNAIEQFACSFNEILTKNP